MEGGDDMATCRRMTGLDALEAFRSRSRDKVLWFRFTDPTTCEPVRAEFLGMDVLDRIAIDGTSISWDGRYLRARFPWGLEVRIHGEPRRRGSHDEE